MRQVSILCLIFMSLLVIGSSSMTARSDDDKITIKEAWIPEGPPSAKTSSAFMVIENHTGKDLALVAAKSTAASATELHKMEMKNNMMEMRRVDRIPIPTDGKVELKSGSYHVMFIGLTKPLKEGDKVSLTLQFSNSSEKTIQVPVKKRGS